MTSGLLSTAERTRLAAAAGLDSSQRGELGQFLTPAPVAHLMASMIGLGMGRRIRMLEPGAGVGSLVAAAVEEILQRPAKPHEIIVDAFELDSALITSLNETLNGCRRACDSVGVRFEATTHNEDFIAAMASHFEPNLFGEVDLPEYDLVITNPPYRKINTDSAHRRLLRSAGVETTNLYSGFMGIAVQLLAHGGEIVSITPRSFCNGTYFRSFRNLLLRTVVFQRMHMFESRKEAFRGDDVLQENVIWRAVRGATPASVQITASGGGAAVSSTRTIAYAQMVWPGDPEQFIHIVPDAQGQSVADRMRGLPRALHELELEVSTGRVVDFRAKANLRKDFEVGTAPLIYPSHFSGGFVRWPNDGRKPNALAVDDSTREQLVPNEVFVLLKRFTSKEERRRVVAVVYDPALVEGEHVGVGFENHVNYIHRRGRGLPLDFAKGLAVFFNSSLVDDFFRQFSGHTQVNATDLRLLRYPTEEQLYELGSRIVDDQLPDQNRTDFLVQRMLGSTGVAA